MPSCLLARRLVQAGVHERVLCVTFEKQSESNAMWALSIKMPFAAAVVAGWATDTCCGWVLVLGC